MSTFTIILLLIIMILIISDVYFLYKIFKTARLKKKSLPDERYFELKYNINLLKAVSAILIFLLGFLGFTTYNDITDIVEGDFEEKFKIQERKIEALDSIVKDYETLVESLKSEEGESIENLNDVKREFGLINRKVSQTQNALRYTPQIFVARGLVYDENTDEMSDKKPFRGNRYYYKNIKTIYGDKLPKFKKPPLLNIQGNSSEFLITNNTLEYFDLLITSTFSVPSKPLREFKFNIWLVPLD